jgi:hypothetical protein
MANRFGNRDCHRRAHRYVARVSDPQASDSEKRQAGGMETRGACRILGRVKEFLGIRRIV